MSEADRQKWEAKYAGGEAPSEPSLLLLLLEDRLPRTGRALDLAGGGGRHALWLARRGLDVTLADISRAGLEIARRRAAEAGLPLQTLVVDLDRDRPAGPWDVIVSCHFLSRPLFQWFPQALAPGGLLLFIQPTKSNLQRHDKPPEPFLLNDGELPSLAAGLEVLHYEEGWLAEGRHDAVLLAKRPPFGVG